MGWVDWHRDTVVGTRRIPRTPGLDWGVLPIVSVLPLRQTWKMPASDVVLLPLCIGIALIGVVVAGVAWRKGSRGRVVQGIGLALAPIALYFTGLLRLLWDAIVALVGWAASIIFTPAMWFGLSLLGLCVVLWVVGGLLTRRANTKDGSTPAVAAGSKSSAVGTGLTASSAAPAKQTAKGRTAKGKAPAQDVDPELAEIEAILKNRGIS